MTAWLKAGAPAKGKVCSNDENNSIVPLVSIFFPPNTKVSVHNTGTVGHI